MIGRRAQEAAGGFTLVELIIAIALIAVLSAAAIPAMQSVVGANARGAAGELAAGMRWLFETASLRHETCRLAIDLDARSWWGECTKDRVVAGRDGAADAREEDQDELAERFPDERDAEKRKLLARAKWGKFGDRVAKKRELPGNAKFVDVWAEHLREPVSKGVAYVYFHPQGRSEEARVPIVEGDHVYSVVMQPWTGRARVVNGKPEVRR